MEKTPRREFIRQIASSLAGASVAIGLQRCGATRGGYREIYGDADVHAVIAKLDEQEKTILAKQGLDCLDEYYESCDCNPNLLRESVASLLAVGTYGDLTQKAKGHPSARQMLFDRGEMISRSVLRTAEYLKNISPEERRELAVQLKANPGFLQEFQQEFDYAARLNGVSPNRLEHFHSLFNKCAWRLEHQNINLVIDEIVAQTDKIIKYCGLSRQEKEAIVLARAQDNASKSEDTSVQPLPAEVTPHTANCTDTIRVSDTVYIVENSKPSSLAEKEIQLLAEAEAWRKVKKKGGGMIIAGLAAFGLGTFLTAKNEFGTGANSIGLVGGMTGGAVSLISGIIIAITGATNQIKSESRFKKISQEQFNKSLKSNHKK